VSFRPNRIDWALDCLRQTCERHASEMVQAAAAGSSQAYGNARFNLRACLLHIADLKRVQQTYFSCAENQTSMTFVVSI